MKASELRTGNICNYNELSFMQGEDEIIVTINNIKYAGLMEPIPLTGKWLIKHRFKRPTSHIGYHEYILKGVRVLITKKSNEISVCNNNGFICEIKYIHQLQNLYFALTGKELIFTK